MTVIILQDPPAEIIEYLKTFQVKPAEQDMITRDAFTRYVEQLGYKAKNPATIQKLCRQFDIEEMKIGKNCWYNVSELSRIPSKK